MAPKVGEIFKLFGVIELVGGKEVVETLVDADKKAKTFGDALKGIATPANAARVGLAAIGTTISAALGFGIQRTNELNQAMSEFQAKTGESAESVKDWRAVVQANYRVSLRSYEELGAAVTALKTDMQMSADQAREDLPIYSAFAKVAGVDLAGAIGDLDDVSDAWNLTAEQTKGLMDQLIVSNQKYGGSVQGSLGALQSLAPATRSLGLSLDETIGLINMFSKSGIDATGTTMALNYAARNFKTPEEFRRALETLQNTADAGDRARLAVEIFGARGGVALANAFGPGRQSLEDFVVSLDESSGATARAGKAFNDNFNVKFALWRKNIEGLVQQLTERLGPAFSVITSGATALGVLFPNLGGAMVAAAGKAGILRFAMDLLAKSFAPFLIGGAIIAGLYAVVEIIKRVKRESELAKIAVADIEDMATATEKLASARRRLTAEEANLQSGMARAGVKSAKDLPYLPTGLQEARAEVEALENRIREIRDKAARDAERPNQPDINTPGTSTWNPEGAKNAALEDAMDYYNYLVSLEKMSTAEEIDYLQRVLDKHAKTTEEKRRLEIDLFRLKKRLRQEEESDALKAVQDGMGRSAVQRAKVQEAIQQIDQEAKDAEEKQLRQDQYVRGELAKGWQKYYDDQRQEQEDLLRLDMQAGATKRARLQQSLKDVEVWTEEMLRAEENRTRYEYSMGLISEEQFLAFLQKKLAGVKEWSDEYIAILNQINEVQAKIDDKKAERGQYVAGQRYQAMGEAYQAQNPSKQLTWFEKAVKFVSENLDKVGTGIKDKLGGAVDWLGKLMKGDWAGAFIDIIAKTKTFRNLIVILARVAKPLIDLMDAILMPILKFVAGIWNAIINALAGINLFGWRPFKGLKKYLIQFDENGDAIGDEEENDTGTGTENTGSKGTQISEITGPTRDILIELLSPLRSLDILVGALNTIRDVLVEIRDGLNFALAPGGSFAQLAPAGGPPIAIYGDVLIQPQTVTDIATLDQLAIQLGQGVQQAGRAIGTS